VKVVFTLHQIAEHVAKDWRGDGDCRICAVSTLQHAKSGDISFLANPLYKKYLKSTEASAVILPGEFVAQCPTSMIIADNPYVTYAKIASLFHPKPTFAAGIHPSAVVDAQADVDPTAWIGPLTVVEAQAQIGARVFIGPGSIVGRGVTLGDDSRLIGRVTLCEHVHIGARAIFHPGVVIGSDGFGIAMDAGRWLKVPQVGTVSIGDDVEIGSNTTVDRGALEDTVIEEGVKIDNQVQIAHNVQIGAHTAIAGCVGISGSVKIGRYCAIGGGVGIAGHLTIVDQVQVTGMSLVSRSITQAGTYSSSTPAMPVDQWHRNFARFRRLDQMYKTLRKIEKVIFSNANEEQN
jgi:UDP-3-O-[3-hydroxymyristoyl] glucosamine N-acyltransferase